MKKEMIIKKQNRYLLTTTSVTIFLISFILVFLLELTTYSFKKTCKSVGSFKDAQFALARGWSNLDRDNDGKACE